MDRPNNRVRNSNINLNRMENMFSSKDQNSNRNYN